MKKRFTTRSVIIAAALIAIGAWLWTATNSRGITDVQLSHHQLVVEAIGTVSYTHLTLPTKA